MNKWISRISYKYRDKGIRNLMYYIVGGMVALYACCFFEQLAMLPEYFEFDRDLIFSGEVWRLISFIFMPELDYNILFFAIGIIFYVSIYNDLESQWGVLRLNVFYLCGIIGCIIGGMITGYTTNVYLNTSLVLAFAAVFPDAPINLFFVLQIKAKYLGWAMLAGSAVTMVFFLIFGAWSYFAAEIFALANVLLFFGGDFFRRVKVFAVSKARKAKWKKQTKDFQRNKDAFRK